MNEVEALVKKQANATLRKLNPEFFSGSVLKPQVTKEPLCSSDTHKTPPKALRGSKNKGLSNKFKWIWNSLGGPPLEEEFRFHPERKFKSDFCHLATRTCIELEGGIFKKGMGHSSITGILRDIEKYNLMVYLGFRVIRFHAGTVNSQNITELIQFLKSRRFCPK